MESYDGFHVAAGEASLLSVASSSGAVKHPYTAGSDLDQPPRKKQRKQNVEFNLDDITLACVVGQEMPTTSLNMLAEPELTGDELRNAHHYSYDEFRRWLQDTADIPRDRAMSIVLPNPDDDGDYCTHYIRNRWDFGGLLQKIKNGFAKVPFNDGIGYFLEFQPCGDELPGSLPRDAISIENATAERAEDEVEPDMSSILRRLEYGSFSTIPQPPGNTNAVLDESVVAGQEMGAVVIADDVGHQLDATDGLFDSVLQPGTNLSAVEDDEVVVIREERCASNVAYQPDDPAGLLYGTPHPPVDTSAAGDGATVMREEKGASGVAYQLDEPAGSITGPPRAVVDLTNVEDAAGDQPGAGTGLDKFTPSLIAGALRFFQVAESPDNKYTIEGIARPIHMYQLYTTYGLLMSPITSGVNGALVGWGVGFGKTMLVLLYLYVRARLACLWDDVQAEWRDKNATGHRHLPRRGQQSGARCPSQHKHVVECPCVASSDSRLICAAYLTNSPALIVIPPGLAHNWLHEMCRVYAGQQDKTKFIEFHSYISKLKHATSIAIRPERLRTVVDNTSGEVVDVVVSEADEEEEIKSFVTSGKGKATDVFLVSSKSVDTLQRKYPVAKGTKTTCFTAGVVIMDEHQQYKGVTESSETIPFIALRQISEAADYPVTLFTLCGTTLEEGPSAWRAPIEHFNSQWDMWQRSGEIRCLDKDGFPATVARFTEARRRYVALIRLLADRGKTPAEIEPDIRMLVDFFKPIRGRPLGWGIGWDIDGGGGGCFCFCRQGVWVLVAI